jgi:hypothetical protein
LRIISSLVSLLVSLCDPANQVHEIALPGAIGHQSGIARVIPFPELVPGRVVSLTEYLGAGFDELHGQQQGGIIKVST